MVYYLALGDIRGSKVKIKGTAVFVQEYFEEKALLSAPNSPKWWFRYVDDSHVCIKREHMDEFHSIPEESCTRSNTKIVIVFTSVRHRAR